MIRTNHLALSLSILGAAFAVVACSGARPSDLEAPATQSTSATLPDGGKGSNGGNAGGGGGGGGGSGGGSTSCPGGCPNDSVCSNGTCVQLPATCPCPVDSYCDLATNSCQAGCLDSSQCSGGRVCDATSRTCQDVCTGSQCNSQACPIPPAPGGTDGGSVCNGIGVQGSPVTMTCHTGTAPVGQGGVVRDGVYVLVQMDYYGTLGCSGQMPTRAVWDICASQWATAHDGSSGGVDTLVSTATITGSSVSLALTCPTGQSSSSATFDATDTTLTLYWSDGFDGAYVERYAKE